VGLEVYRVGTAPGTAVPAYLASALGLKENGQMAEITQLRCIHCGKSVDETTKDHVFPTSWYPETTPEETRRWTAPSCGKCNNSLGSMEKKVFSRLILCVDPQKHEAAGLYAKLKRSLGVGVDDLSKDEAAHRQKQKLGLIAAVERHDSASSGSILPGLGSHTGFRDEDLPQIRIPGDLLLKVYEKIVRGCEYVLAGRIIEEPYSVQIYFVHDHNIPEDLARGLESPTAEDVHLGPGFRVVRVAAHDSYAVAYEITLWGSAYFFAFIMNRSEAELAPPAN
jgi:hypothetical protein